MKPHILLINPNSSQHVTDGLSSAVDCYRRAGVEFHCVTLAGAPLAIISTLDVEKILAPIQQLFDRCKGDAVACIVACFYDPGVGVLRSMTSRPVFGIGESSFHVAMSMANKFGIITASEMSAALIDQRMCDLGISGRCVGNRSISMSILDVKARPDMAFDRLLVAGKELANTGAQAVIMAGAAMTPFRHQLQSLIGINVVDPVLAAAGLATAAGLTFNQ